MAEKITARLQTPADSSGNRRDVHLITTTDEVIVNPDEPTSETLTEYLKDIDGQMETLTEEVEAAEGKNAVVISDSAPTTSYNVIWCKPM